MSVPANDFDGQLVSMILDGQPALSASIGNPRLGPGSSLAITVGVNWVTPPQAATQSFYDNVLINAQ